MTADKLKLQKSKSPKSHSGEVGLSVPVKSPDRKIKKRDELLDLILNPLTHPFLIIDANDYTVKRYKSGASSDKLPQETTCYQLRYGRRTPCLKDNHICPIREIKKTKKPVVVEYIHDDNKGNQKIYEVHGFPILNDAGDVIEIIQYSLDITGQKQAIEALRTSEEKYRSIFETAANLIISVNTEGIIVDCNHRVEKFLGYTRDEIIGQSMVKIIAPEYLEKAQQSLAEILSEGFLYGHKYQMIRKNGSRIDVSINSSALKGPDGKYERTICIIDDITERKRAREKFKNTHSKLIAEQLKLRAKNTALKEVLQQIDDEKRLLKVQIQTNTNRIIMPLLDKLREKANKNQSEYVDMLEKSLTEITSPFVNQLELKFSSLSPRELEVCNMLRDGQTTKQIASNLDISFHTVLKQRQNIRKKLGIANADINLHTFLKSISADQTV